MPYCAYCGHEVSASAATCPNCGHPQGTPVAAPGRAQLAGVQGAPVVLEYAGFWIRLGSLFLDGLILFIVQIPLFAASVATSVAYSRGRGFLFSALYNPLSIGVGFLYVWLMVGYAKGQTLGMMATGIRITRPDGSPVDLGRSAARAGMSIVSRIPFSLGYLWAAWDPEKRTWHDMVADTRVYKVPR
jgi:uncharacterized RDD family membrane protein YckC